MVQMFTKSVTLLSVIFTLYSLELFMIFLDAQSPHFCLGGGRE